MKRAAIGLILIFSSAWISTPACSPSRETNPSDLSRLLPDSTRAGGWERNGEPGIWEGEDLYVYINGGAEIYQEYGFERILIQDYKNPADSSISLEIYEMTEAPAAFGMFTFKTSSTGENLDIGQGGQIEDYYLNFWQDRYLVTLTGFDQKPETVSGLKLLAEAVADRFRKGETGAPPALISRLPQEGLLPTGLKYFRGHLGLFNSYPFSQQDIFRIHEAVKGRYADGYDVYLIPYVDESTGSEVFQSAKEVLIRSTQFHDAAASEHGLRFFDGENTLIRMESVGADIVIVIGGTEPAAEKVITALSKHLDIT